MTSVKHEVAEQLTTHLRNDTTDQAAEELRVPISDFVSEERAVLERDLLKRLPVIIGRSSEIAKPGNFITREVMGIPVIVSRQSNGHAAGYVNICRHRGGRVEDAECGSKRFFTCKYHGWSYSGDGGGLRGVPYDKFYTNVDRDRNSLHLFKVEEKHGFLFADFSSDSERNITDWLGPEVNEQLASFDLEDAAIYLDKSFTLDINWKVVLDGAIDVLHPKFLHPEGVGKLIETNTSVWKDYGRHGQVFSPRTKMGDLIRAGEEIEAAWKLISCNLFVYPNTMVIAAPDHVELWTVWPDPHNANRSTTQIRFLADAEHLASERGQRRMAKSWEILEDAAVNDDWPMELTIQQNSEAWPDGTYLYGRNEQPCQHLHRQLAKDLGIELDGITG
ncbi:aromatic ring-hydroxylating oxygenase subunit alpha [Gordonia sp. DT30]|uniref:aromatic ring-hydroxylating oxygenase subunit alpha n=1 Tax=Gordonia sp. DT30 TaxID=3416546 RepID=UPI003CE819A6